MSDIYELIRGYENRTITGFRHEIAEEEFNLLKSEFVPEDIVESDLYGDIPDYFNGYEIAREVLGEDIDLGIQKRGSCGAFGGCNVIKHLMCTEILLKKDREVYSELIPSYTYGISRLARDIGGNRIGRKEGTISSWVAIACQRYGVLSKELSGLTYSGELDDKFGNLPGPDKKYIELAKDYPVRSVTRVRNVDVLRKGLANGYFATIGSSIGYTHEPDRTGFHKRQGVWEHAMMISSYFLKPSKGFIIPNSWGDVHGRLTDFITKKLIPKGCLRITEEDMQIMIDDGECIMYSDLQGFVKREIPFEKFNLLR